MASHVLRFLVVLCLLIVPAVCSAASLTLAIPAVEGAAGAQIKATLLVKDAQGLGALEMELTYDLNILELIEVQPGSILSGLLDYNLLQPGRVKIAMATSQAVSGSGELFVVSFKVLSGGRSPLRLEKVLAWEQANSQEMTVSLEPGVFATSSGVATALPVADRHYGFSFLTAGIILLVLVVIVLAFVFRSQLLTALRQGRASSSPAGVIPGSQWKMSTLLSHPVGGLRCLECGQILSIDSMFCRTCGATVKPPPPTVKCHACDQLMPEDSRFCPHCGKLVPALHKQCPQCGQTVEGDARFCPSCGVKLS